MRATLGKPVCSLPLGHRTEGHVRATLGKPVCSLPLGHRTEGHVRATLGKPVCSLARTLLTTTGTWLHHQPPSPLSKDKLLGSACGFTQAHRGSPPICGGTRWR